MIALLFILSVCITICIDAWMEHGMILHWYYKLLHKYSNVKLDAKGNILSSRWFYKPLGGCMKCFHVWVVIFVAWWLCIPIEKFIISLGCSYVILDKLFYK